MERNLRDIRNQMWQAAVKAEKNSNEYNRLDTIIEREARHHCTERGITRTSTITVTINDFKDKDERLQKAYSRYNFWRGEQIRLASLLLAEQAYQSMVSNIPLWTKSGA